ncbi:hypothetical protein B9Z55_027385 [Caenorhabditis nigoni]|uniref:Uncharacterized protein n=1 Tax=Caenorhabditis nigoni TaxID=1611254 RepID=A0A2G5SGA9_9PELO|nr:hypothetical protein B9Z55_027385 [Caenorhabditis nigoni]
MIQRTSNWFFNNVYCNIVFHLLTFLSTPFAIKKIRSTAYFQKSTVFLLISNMCFGMLHNSIYLVIQTSDGSSQDAKQEDAQIPAPRSDVYIVRSQPSQELLVIGATTLKILRRSIQSIRSLEDQKEERDVSCGLRQNQIGPLCEWSERFIGAQRRGHHHIPNANGQRDHTLVQDVCGIERAGVNPDAKLSENVKSGR